MGDIGVLVTTVWFGLHHVALSNIRCLSSMVDSITYTPQWRSSDIICWETSWKRNRAVHTQTNSVHFTRLIVFWISPVQGECWKGGLLLSELAKKLSAVTLSEREREHRDRCMCLYGNVFWTSIIWEWEWNPFKTPYFQPRQLIMSAWRIESGVSQARVLCVWRKDL